MKSELYASLATTAICISFMATSVSAAHHENGEHDMATMDHSAGMEMPEAKTYPIITNDRSEIGTLMLSEADGQVVAHVKVSGISPGKHGVHFHAVADCSDEKFLNTTGHINPMGHQHGLNNPDGPDNADLPNLVADENGMVDQVLMSPRVTLMSGTDMRPSLLDDDGSALVIHANEDDQVSQPIGGAGARIGCAEIN